MRERTKKRREALEAGGNVGVTDGDLNDIAGALIRGCTGHIARESAAGRCASSAPRTWRLRGSTCKSPVHDDESLDRKRNRLHESQLGLGR